MMLARVYRTRIPKRIKNKLKKMGIDNELIEYKLDEKLSNNETKEDTDNGT